jgi:flagellar M-ring protein FliF
MPRQVSSALQRFAAMLGQFTIAQRTVAVIGIAVLALGIAALGMWAAKPSYTPLFSGLSATDASSIVDQLTTDGVPYELTNGGATIMVPQDNVYDERLKAAAAGLPTSSTGGYALLDTMGVTSSEFQQSVTYKRALEGELASTIQAMKGIQTASVRLAIPEETVFVSEKTNPTASVFVETKNGTTLGVDQVQAIVHLTSASIQGMEASDVAVIDAEGSVLSAVGVGATGSADQQASDYEGRVQQAVQTMLDKVIGPGNASVVVAADMSYESAQRTEESFTTPEDAPALNEAVKTETYSGTGGGAAGVLGPDNIAVPAGAAGDGTFSSEDTTRNNAVNKVTESRTIPAGAITRQTVSVALNADAADDLSVQDVTNLVSAAAGINTRRGDDVTVELVNFNGAGAKAAAKALAEAEKAAADERTAGIVQTAILAAGTVLIFIAGLIVYARRSRRQTREAIELGELSQTHPALEPAADPFSFEAPTVPLIVTPAPEVIEPSRAGSRRADIDALAARDPQRTADVLRSLMDDRQPV